MMINLPTSLPKEYNWPTALTTDCQLHCGRQDHDSQRTPYSLELVSATLHGKGVKTEDENNAVNQPVWR